MAIGRVIAVRRLESATEPRVTVTVQIGAPRKTRGQDDFFCPYRILGSGDGKVRAAYGVDAVQALQLAMRAIGAALAKTPDLRWFHGADLGFPHPDEMLAGRNLAASGAQRTRDRARFSPAQKRRLRVPGRRSSRDATMRAAAASSRSAVAPLVATTSSSSALLRPTTTSSPTHARTFPFWSRRSAG